MSQATLFEVLLKRTRLEILMEKHGIQTVDDCAPTASGTYDR